MMTPAQQRLYDLELQQAQKNDALGMLLALLLGGLGAHRFYLKDMTGFVYVVFCWTFIPAIVGVVEAFLMPARVRAYNEQQAQLIAARILART